LAAADGSDEEHSSPTGAAIPWAGATIVAIGTFCAALIFLLHFDLDLDEGPNGPINRLLIAAGLLGVALVLAASRFRPSGGVRFGLAGLAATALAGPGIGAMMVLPPTPPARTLLRIWVYVLCWTVGAVPMFVGISDAPQTTTFIFAVLLTVCPLCVPLADWLAIRRHRQPSGAT
jgi:heme/copper-type cytochrome/quinol oxidase subunit 4